MRLSSREMPRDSPLWEGFPNRGIELDEGRITAYTIGIKSHQVDWHPHLWHLWALICRPRRHNRYTWRSGAAFNAQTKGVDTMLTMPWRLHRYLLVELLRIIGLTTAVLVVVTAFGAVIKPLATGVPLGPGQALTYVALSTVPMLQYALPFAAGFGATLVLHRMASDNEIAAMAAAGLPYRVILVPVITFAAVLAIVLSILANTAIPQIYAVMGRVIAGDMVTLLEHSVRNGQPMAIGDMQIWAEHMRLSESPTPGGKRVQLDRVAAARVAGDGAIQSDVSARAAVLDMQEVDGVVEVRMVMEDAVSWDAHGGGLCGFPRIEPTRPISVPMPERVEPMAMTRSELIEVAANPIRYPPIAETVQVLRDALREDHELHNMQQRLRADGVLQMESLDRPGRSWSIVAKDIKRGVLVGDSTGVRVIQKVNGKIQSTFVPAVAHVRLQSVTGLDRGGARSIVIAMNDVRVQSSDSRVPANHRATVDVANLTLLRGAAYTPLDHAQMLEQAELAAQSNAGIANVLRRLRHQETQLQGQVTSRLWRRWAVGITAGLLPLLGAVLALLLRHAQPLSVYMIGFIPGLLDLVLISAGAGSIRQGHLLGGLGLMWSGSFIVLLATGFAWWRLRRN